MGWGLPKEEGEAELEKTTPGLMFWVADGWQYMTLFDTTGPGPWTGKPRGRWRAGSETAPSGERTNRGSILWILK
jgi:hypothetical protein